MIITEPLPYAKGLLGGASKDGKMSKLAALAAKRRQKEAAAAAADSAVQKASDSQPDEYAASLSKLSLGNDRLRDRKESASAADKEPVNTLTIDDRKHTDSSAVESSKLDDEPIVTRKTPSAFAGTFLDSTPTIPSFAIDPNDLVDKPSFNFNDPSPDDVVFKAQTGRSR